MLSLTNAIYNIRVIKSGSHVTVTCLMIIHSVRCKAFNVRLKIFICAYGFLRSTNHTWIHNQPAVYSNTATLVYLCRILLYVTLSGTHKTSIAIFVLLQLQ